MSCHTVRTAGTALAACACALVPWTAWLAVSLPASAVAVRWSTAWVGLDLAIAAGAAASAVLVGRGRRGADLALMATATAMVADAWFDVVTSGGADHRAALVEAGALELPLAAAAVVLAVRLGTHRPPARHGAEPRADARDPLVPAGGAR